MTAIIHPEHDSAYWERHWLDLFERYRTTYQGIADMAAAAANDTEYTPPYNRWHDGPGYDDLDPCPTCGGDGDMEDEEGFWSDCPTCRPA